MYPILFKLGPITIYSYGVSVACAFIITSYLIIRDCAKYGIPKDKMWNLLLWIFISGIIGARLLHVILNFSYYKIKPLEIVMLHRGGLAIHGAIVAAILMSTIFLLKDNLSLWKAGDLIMLYLPLGQAIGRIGCFLRGCCYGKYGHPTQIYSSIALFIIFVTLRHLNKKKKFDGEIFLSYFLIYLPVRFFIDFLRGDLSIVLFSLTVSQLISILLFVISLCIYGKFRFKSRR